MKQLRFILPGILSIILSLSLLGGCSKPPKENPAGPGGKPGAARPAMRGERGGGGPGIRMIPVTIQPIIMKKQYVGEIKPYYSVDLRSNTSGWLSNIRVDSGYHVEKNSVICVIEHDDVKAQADQAEANITVSKASVARAQAELERVRSESRRTESLYEKGYLSKRDLEQAQTNEKQALASLDSAKGQLAQADAQLRNTLVKLRDTTIRAPFSGVVAERYADPGAYLSPSNPVVRLVDDSRVKAVINVVEEDFPSLRKGRPAVVELDSLPGKTFKGEISLIAPAMDDTSRTAMVEILIPNPDRMLRGGMTARTTLILSENPSATVVPENTLRNDPETGKDYVFIADRGKVARRDITTGIRTSGMVEILNGLKAGDMVIPGDARVSEGMDVAGPQRKGGPR